MDEKVVKLEFQLAEAKRTVKLLEDTIGGIVANCNHEDFKVVDGDEYYSVYICNYCGYQSLDCP